MGKQLTSKQAQKVVAAASIYERAKNFVKGFGSRIRKFGGKLISKLPSRIQKPVTNISVKAAKKGKEAVKAVKARAKTAKGKVGSGAIKAAAVAKMPSSSGKIAVAALVAKKGY